MLEPVVIPTWELKRTATAASMEYALKRIVARWKELLQHNPKGVTDAEILSDEISGEWPWVPDEMLQFLLGHVTMICPRDRVVRFSGSTSAVPLPEFLQMLMEHKSPGRALGVAANVYFKCDLPNPLDKAVDYFLDIVAKANLDSHPHRIKSFGAMSTRRARDGSIVSTKEDLISIIHRCIGAKKSVVAELVDFNCIEVKYPDEGELTGEHLLVKVIDGPSRYTIKLRSYIAEICKKIVATGDIRGLILEPQRLIESQSIKDVADATMDAVTHDTPNVSVGLNGIRLFVGRVPPNNVIDIDSDNHFYIEHLPGDEVWALVGPQDDLTMAHGKVTGWTMLAPNGEEQPHITYALELDNGHVTAAPSWHVSTSKEQIYIQLQMKLQGFKATPAQP